jgi:type IV fimbrial biogenesis protein FimT
MYMKQSLRGFTLIEMMVTIAVMAILLSLAVPSFRESALTSQLRSASTDLLSAANLARSESVKRRAIVTLCVSNADQTACGAGGFYAEATDNDGLTAES